jgi:hypothetical protein
LQIGGAARQLGRDHDRPASLVRAKAGGRFAALSQDDTNRAPVVDPYAFDVRCL